MVRRSKRINKKERKPKIAFSKEENRLYNQFKVKIQEKIGVAKDRVEKEYRNKIARRMTKAKIGGFLEKYNEMYPLKSKIKKGKYPRLDTYHRQCKMCGYLTNKRSLDRHYKD